jgi:glycosyltransferase involved in cell wall biosynthesis
MHFWGGGEKLHLEYAEKFLEKGYRVILFIGRDSPLDLRALDKRFIKEYVHVNKLSFLNPLKVYLLSLRIKKYKPKFIVFSASQDMKLASLAGAKAGVPSRVYLRGLAVPVKNNFFNRRLFYKVITHFAMNSLETERCTLGNFDRSKISALVRVIYHGIDLDEFRPGLKSDMEFRAGFSGVIIGNAGRLTPQKSQIDLIKAAALLKERSLDFKILIAGSGDLQEQLQHAINSYKVTDKVTLIGFVRDMPRFLSNIDVFVLTSHWEGFGYVLVESMALGKPLVAYQVSSNPEIIEDGANGFLCTINIKDLAAKMEQLILDAELRQIMGEKGRKIAGERFGIDDRVNEFEVFINEKVPVIHNQSGSPGTSFLGNESKGHRRNYQR